MGVDFEIYVADRRKLDDRIGRIVSGDLEGIPADLSEEIMRERKPIGLDVLLNILLRDEKFMEGTAKTIRSGKAYLPLCIRETLEKINQEKPEDELAGYLDIARKIYGRDLEMVFEFQRKHPEMITNSYYRNPNCVLGREDSSRFMELIRLFIKRKLVYVASMPEGEVLIISDGDSIYAEESIEEELANILEEFESFQSTEKCLIMVFC